MRIRDRLIAVVGAVAVAAAVGSLALTSVAAQAPTGSIPKAPDGKPDLSGVWANEHVVPLERPAQFAGKEFKTDAELAAAEQALIKEKESEGPGRDSREVAGKPGIGTERDVARAYNEFWFGDTPTKPGKRTSQIVDPPDGKLPPLTAAAIKERDDKREYLQALLQGTSGGKPGPKSPRRSESSPDYNLDRINRSDGPEDRGGPERCIGGAPPQPMGVAGIAGSYRIVQGMDSVAFYYDIGQGQGYSLAVPVTNLPHLPSSIREYRGDPRGRWEGDTFVVDTTNFTQKTNFRGSRQNLHLIERYKRTSATTLEYRLTVEDPAVFARPWTLVQELTLQDNKANLVQEGACHEGNYGLLGMLSNTRAAERDFKAGKGPDPDLQDNATGGGN